MKMKFNVGDRVKLVNNSYTGMNPEGTVIKVDHRYSISFPYSVEFDGESAPFLVGENDIAYINPTVERALEILWNDGLGKAPYILNDELTPDLDGLYELRLEKPLQSKCRHEMIPYVGLSESYSYCKHCDKKEGHF